MINIAILHRFSLDGLSQRVIINAWNKGLQELLGDSKNTLAAGRYHREKSGQMIYSADDRTVKAISQLTPEKMKEYAQQGKPIETPPHEIKNSAIQFSRAGKVTSPRIALWTPSEATQHKMVLRKTMAACVASLLIAVIIMIAGNCFGLASYGLHGDKWVLAAKVCIGMSSASLFICGIFAWRIWKQAQDFTYQAAANAHRWDITTIDGQAAQVRKVIATPLSQQRATRPLTAVN